MYLWLLGGKLKSCAGASSLSASPVLARIRRYKSRYLHWHGAVSANHLPLSLRLRLLKINKNQHQNVRNSIRNAILSLPASPRYTKISAQNKAVFLICADQDIGSCILEIENQSYNGIDEIDFQILAKCVVSLRFLLWSRRRVKRLPHSARAGGNCRML